MKIAFLAAVVLAIPIAGRAQTDHQQHHPAGSGAPQAQSQPQTAPMQPPTVTGQFMGPGQTQMGPMMEQMPEQCRIAMQQMMVQMMRNPDAAFVKGMIPHHQSAIDMARVALQYGKDDQVKKWASDVIREQEREIGEMQAWLKKHGH